MLLLLTLQYMLYAINATLLNVALLFFLACYPELCNETL
jgi:hypothetical protein